MSDQSRRYAALDLAWLPSISNAPTLAEHLAAAVEDLDGLVGVHESPSAWRVVFGSTAARDRALDDLNRQFRHSGLSVSPLEIPDEDWARRSQADLQPVRIGGILVLPPWSAVPADAGHATMLVRILPSMGFGTGHHPTTRLCLGALQHIDLTARSFLDIGTGSGVLAIAACLLGAHPVTAVDSDADAIDAAHVNLSLNGVEGGVRLMTGDFRRSPGIRARIATANLTGAALMKSGSELAACVEPGGLLVVSGFTNDEAPAVLSALARIGHVVRRQEEDGWCVATLRVLGEHEARHD